MAITSSMTAREIVTAAMRINGSIGLADTPTANEAALAITHLNWMLKTWQAYGLCNGWRVESIELSWLAATASATLNTNYLDLANVRYRSATDIDRDLTQISLAEYASLPNKAQVGPPTCYAIRKTQASIELNLWPVSAAVMTIAADASRVITDVTTLDQAVDVPQEWTETTFYCLAARLIAPFRVHISDPVGAQMTQQRAADLYAALKSFDDETASVFFMPAQ